MTEEDHDTLETFAGGLFDIAAREKSGEFEILSWEVGPRNAQYKVRVRWPTEKQQELLTP